MSELVVTTLPGLQDACAVACGVADSDADARRVVDELMAQTVSYCACKRKGSTPKDRARAEKKIRKRAKTKLIGGGILESIVLSLLAQLAISVFNWFWNWKASTPDSSRVLASMAVGLSAWGGDADD